ncbi:hypothetical protein EUGRSUZ_I00222 [Eucalyptus grandis]|uniref:Uncharacterized protein n=2 Tax=Eucalyptus grandis TaxID=71139 RepID=A0ACC3JB38_EUCGR|nr:hypothetical protein EUGRSUZ_I00222 [Eucalyptus grandis]
MIAECKVCHHKRHTFTIPGSIQNLITHQANESRHEVLSQLALSYTRRVLFSSHPQYYKYRKRKGNILRCDKFRKQNRSYGEIHY